jgi:3-isopropylmalate/(R)-2-methylmalate dehydratase small subunit
MNAINGKVWMLGDNIDTDSIVPGQFLDAPIDEVVKHVFESIKPEFVKEVRPGDVIIAGRNFGCGSSRENAPAALKKLGVACIAAESFARIFFRNALAIGLPLVICKGVPGIFAEGEEARIAFREARVENVKNGSVLEGEAFSDEIIAIVEKGGILEMLKALKKQ